MSEYFSKIECAGGCGNLLPQSVVDSGRKYLWGHKGGCPKEGESARRKKPGVELVGSSPSSKTGPVVHTNYERTLAMTLENLEASMAELESVGLAMQALAARETYVRTQFRKAVVLAQALMAVVPPDAIERKRAAELLGLNEPAAEPGAAAVSA